MFYMDEQKAIHEVSKSPFHSYFVTTRGILAAFFVEQTILAYKLGKNKAKKFFFFLFSMWPSFCWNIFFPLRIKPTPILNVNYISKYFPFGGWSVV